MLFRKASNKKVSHTTPYTSLNHPHHVTKQQHKNILHNDEMREMTINQSTDNLHSVCVET